MRALWSGEIAFALVTIPTKLYAATRNLTPKFHLVHKACGTRVQMVRRCPKCEVDLSWDVSQGQKLRARLRGEAKSSEGQGRQAIGREPACACPSGGPRVLKPLTTRGRVDRAGILRHAPEAGANQRTSSVVSRFATPVPGSTAQ